MEEETKVHQTVLTENSRSVAGRPLPPIDAPNSQPGSILLFYQYKEPAWTEKEFKKVLKQFIALGTKHGITGRGRVAREGVNCTLSGLSHAIRDFCTSLRQWDKLFLDTDFKITDDIPRNQLFKSLSIRKTKELVAYGMDGERAPSLQKFAGHHLEANDYHKAMMDKDSVIIDVRNSYESAIGTFQPPKDGAEWIDPKMRNSIEWAKWLSDPQTQAKLNGKKVLTFCTGGIRCERATALMNQISTANPGFQPQAVYELRGGIERYIKTFPDGGFWKGKNYLFDRRMEQVPANKSAVDVEKEVQSKCCLCRQKWTSYRGKFKCSSGLCGVPVIVCPDCVDEANDKPSSLQCELCHEGYRAPTLAPDLLGLKRKADNVSPTGQSDKKSRVAAIVSNNTATNKLFVSRLPLVVNKQKILSWIGDSARTVFWLKDRSSHSFYGSCIVEMESSKAVETVIERGLSKLEGARRQPKVGIFHLQDGESWPPALAVESDYPPIGS